MKREPTNSFETSVFINWHGVASQKTCIFQFIYCLLLIDFRLIWCFCLKMTLRYCSSFCWSAPFIRLWWTVYVLPFVYLVFRDNSSDKNDELVSVCTSSWGPFLNNDSCWLKFICRLTRPLDRKEKSVAVQPIAFPGVSLDNLGILNKERERERMHWAWIRMLMNLLAVSIIRYCCSKVHTCSQVPSIPLQSFGIVTSRWRVNHLFTAVANREKRLLEINRRS